MTRLPVSWSEGMFLRPHDFQAADRYWSEQLRQSVTWHVAYDYGARSISYSPEAIQNSQFELSAFEGRFRDGTQLVMREPELDRLDLKDAFRDRNVVRICLAIPRMRAGEGNVSLEADSTLRFREIVLEESDEHAGGNEQEVTYRKLNARLCLESDALKGYEVLPIAQVRRAGERESTPVIDDHYCPPLLTVDCWPELHLEIIRAVHDLIGQKIDLLSQQVRNRGITLGGMDPGDLERIFMLHALNEADASLGTLVYAVGLHPFPLFVEMCRIVGMLSVFGPERRVVELPRYDHDDLDRVFRRLKQMIEILLGGVAEYEYEQRYFIGTGPGLAVTLDSKWLGSNWNWFIGASSSRKHDVVLDLLKGGRESGRLDWKIGSSDQVDRVYSQRGRGLVLNELPQAPRALPTGSQWIFYEVEQKGPMWDQVVQTQTLAMRLNKQIISNFHELEGQRKLKVAVGADEIDLEFALFAVPVRAGLK
ncbi:MAG: type VI secretion system baseplate subunit TssK [Planctomycetaceae bacterium]|nr:type VI secretion system baseplate subunit TssK [Planctomycetaceae bacterium]